MGCIWAGLGVLGGPGARCDRPRRGGIRRDHGRTGPRRASRRLHLAPQPPRP